ncbi:hypothetical protein LAC81_27055 [Ensifer adhaerens]|uniref:hypothetical protein n=1 Tax=Ensifer adhaerens TaxID=106592 RepID=UPI001CBBF2B9|nr:hypothetical protein [Ensifer adhaerens]MBZ7924390.1 hypothetical protein [Ensifer adhaerens]UAX96364.1 hypothetical protein LAC78_21430 [Ensifer adhaerens]UAY04293.1 hypothetical protein LAC80_23530 [Ensifer adhaerens]UAY12279.1 hypothetical protein LAC81_27055 [Ensifer adhaerens]
MKADSSCDFLSPEGNPIVGTSEKILATASISGIDPTTGKPLYFGGTEVHRDTQETLERAGKILFVCSEGNEWTFDQLVPTMNYEAELSPLPFR